MPTRNYRYLEWLVHNTSKQYQVSKLRFISSPNCILLLVNCLNIPLPVVHRWILFEVRLVGFNCKCWKIALKPPLLYTFITLDIDSNGCVGLHFLKISNFLPLVYDYVVVDSMNFAQISTPKCIESVDGYVQTIANETSFTIWVLYLNQRTFDSIQTGLKG